MYVCNLCPSLGPAATALPPPLLPLQVVYDPFFQDMPRFFNCTFKELLAAKHPTAWLQVGQYAAGICRAYALQERGTA